MKQWVKSKIKEHGMQEGQTSKKQSQVTTESTNTALKPYQKPTLYKIDDNLSEVEGGACNVSESSCGVLS